MNNSKIQAFNIGRFLSLIRNDVIINFRPTIVAIGAVAGISLVMELIIISRFTLENLHAILYGLILFIGGFALTSAAFSDLHPAPKRIFYLTLPASPREKYASKLLITSLGYTLLTLVAYFIFSLLQTGMSILIFKKFMPIFNPFRSDIALITGVYLVTQSIFLTGAVFFKKSAFFSTLLVLLAFMLVIGIFASLIFRLVFAEYFTGFFNQSIGLYYDATPVHFKFFLTGILPVIAKILFWGMLAPLFWIIGYYRLKETEV